MSYDSCLFLQNRFIKKFERKWFFFLRELEGLMPLKISHLEEDIKLFFFVEIITKIYPHIQQGIYSDSSTSFSLKIFQIIAMQVGKSLKITSWRNISTRAIRNRCQWEWNGTCSYHSHTSAMKNCWVSLRISPTNHQRWLSQLLWLALCFSHRTTRSWFDSAALQALFNPFLTIPIRLRRLARFWRRYLTCL